MNEIGAVGQVEEGLRQVDALAFLTQKNISVYTSSLFWDFVSDEKTPLEVLVTLLRSDVISRDRRRRDELFEVIRTRISKDNERWAYWHLRIFNVPSEELYFLKHDLCADLDFAIYRSLIDKKRSYWEENFTRSLSCERRHLLSWFMCYERFWKATRVKQSERVPRTRLISIDRVMQNVYGQEVSFDIEDEWAQKMMQRVELSDIWRYVRVIPHRLRLVIYLRYCEGKSSREIAQVLRISDRTVRNRLRTAYNVLRVALEADIC